MDFTERERQKYIEHLYIEKKTKEFLEKGGKIKILESVDIVNDCKSPGHKISFNPFFGSLGNEEIVY